MRAVSNVPRPSSTPSSPASPVLLPEGEEGFISALYTGAVTHQRFAPRRHHLRYAMFQMLFDLDETSSLSNHLRLFSQNAFNLVSFHDRDHGDGRDGPLRGWVEETLDRAGAPIDGGRILLLCMPRVLGHVFNPLSIYFCHRRDGALAAMLYEVNNTFGERHSYLIPVSDSAADPMDAPIRQSCAKAFHVSPFMDMAMTYDFQITPPGETLATTVHGKDAAGALLLAAAFTGVRQPVTDGVLARAVLTHPLLTLKVVAAIHLEAAKLLLKGLRLRPCPPAPSEPVSVG
jgi:DUF1365 family protein